MIFYILTILVGLTSPLQTAVNSRLRTAVGDATVAAFISFSVGTMILLAVFFISGEYRLFSLPTIAAVPWWCWMGGICGVIFVATIMPLFKAIGSVQSMVLPIFGQIVSSIIIDNYGWLGMPQHSVTPIRLIGMVLVFVGVIMIVVVPNIKELRTSASKNIVLWQIYGVILGVIMTFNTVSTGNLGVHLNSTIMATTFAFIIGTILLKVICLSRRKLSNALRLFNKENPWWIGLGGVFGAILIGGYTYLIPIIGVGALAVLALLGQMIISLFIDKFGLFEAEKKPVGWAQIAGVVVMLVGVTCINLL